MEQTGSTPIRDAMKKKHGWGYRTLSDQILLQSGIDISYSKIRRIDLELQQSGPSEKIIIAIANALDIEPDVLIAAFARKRLEKEEEERRKKSDIFQSSSILLQAIIAQELTGEGDPLTLSRMLPSHIEYLQKLHTKSADDQIHKDYWLAQLLLKYGSFLLDLETETTIEDATKNVIKDLKNVQYALKGKKPPIYASNSEEQWEVAQIFPDLVLYIARIDGKLEESIDGFRRKVYQLHTPHALSLALRGPLAGNAALVAKGKPLTKEELRLYQQDQAVALQLMPLVTHPNYRAQVWEGLWSGGAQFNDPESETKEYQRNMVMAMEEAKQDGVLFTIVPAQFLRRKILIQLENPELDLGAKPEIDETIDEFNRKHYQRFIEQVVERLIAHPNPELQKYGHDLSQNEDE